jgi:hypothetical protein
VRMETRKEDLSLSGFFDFNILSNFTQCLIQSFIYCLISSHVRIIFKRSTISILATCMSTGPSSLYKLINPRWPLFHRMILTAANNLLCPPKCFPLSCPSLPSSLPPPWILPLPAITRSTHSLLVI